MITDKLRQYLADEIKDKINSGQIGYGGNSTDPTSTTLDVPSGVSVTINEQSTATNVVQIKLSIAGSDIQGKIIREMGLFDSSSNMLIRQNFDGVGPFSTTETLEIFYTVEVE